MARQWFPLYVNDYLGDTQRLNTTEHGAYMLLLMDYWAKGAPPPDDLCVLGNIIKMTPKKAQKTLSNLRGFFTVRDGHWHHERMQAEIEKANNYSSVQAGRRRGKTKQTGNRGKTDGSSTDKPPTPTVTKKDISEPNGSGAGAPRTVDSILFTEGLGWLKANSDKPEGALRKMIGLWRRDFGDVETMRALSAAMKNEISDPIPYIQKAIRPPDPSKETPFGQRLTEQRNVVDGLMEAVRENAHGNGTGSPGTDGKAARHLPDARGAPGDIHGGTDKTVSTVLAGGRVQRR